jgi:hypothetical protein
MRRIFIILMIVLLPLRGWAGAVMAAEMSAYMVMQNETAINFVAAAAYPERVSATFNSENELKIQPECPGHAAQHSGLESASATAQESDQTTPKAHCENCGTCQVCNSLVLSSNAAVQSTVLPKSSLAPAAGFSFASALLATGQKPPIS